MSQGQGITCQTIAWVHEYAREIAEGDAKPFVCHLSRQVYMAKVAEQSERYDGKSSLCVHNLDAKQ